MRSYVSAVALAHTHIYSCFFKDLQRQVEVFGVTQCLRRSLCHHLKRWMSNASKTTPPARCQHRVGADMIPKQISPVAKMPGVRWVCSMGH